MNRRCAARRDREVSRRSLLLYYNIPSILLSSGNFGILKILEKSRPAVLSLYGRRQLYRRMTMENLVRVSETNFRDGN